MTRYPSQIDTDNDIPAVDDGNTEWSGEFHNKSKEAIIAIETTLGTNPQGTTGSVAERINVSLDETGNLRSSAITALGLLNNIVNAQIATNAEISESKLNLQYHTYDLKTLIDSLSSQITSVNTFVSNVFYTDFIKHLSGTTDLLSSGTSGRHNASHINLNTTLKDKLNNDRSIATVMDALVAINNDLVGHETAALLQHKASAIQLVVDNFSNIPHTVDNVQKAIEYIDSVGDSIYGEFGAIMNSNGITRVACTDSTTISDTLPVATSIDGVTSFFKVGAITAQQLDKTFTKISVGDYITINYGSVVSTYTIGAILFEPQKTWAVKIDGTHQFIKASNDPGYAFFQQKESDDNVFGSLAVCPANHDLWTNYAGVPSSLIVVPPNSAQILGLDLNLADLDSTHYNLYIDFYPKGTVDQIIHLPGIDVTGNKGTTPNNYTLEDVIRNTNNSFRASGYNYRIVAFERKGQFGLAIADNYDNAGFSICSGVVVNGKLQVYQANNVIGNDREDSQDALGLGNAKANVASPVYTPTESYLPTKIILGKKNKKFNIFGNLKSELEPNKTANADGYWTAIVLSQSQQAASIETTYRITTDISASNIQSGNTIVVLPTISNSNSLYNNYDYGRFFVKNITITGCAPNITTDITVLNSIATTGLPLEGGTNLGLPVRIYFDQSSVVLRSKSLADISNEINTKRLHEIYVNTSGQIFSYERLRFDLPTAEIISLADSDKSYGWHIIGASPKLKGYIDSSLQNRRFILIEINSYNSNDKSFAVKMLSPIDDTHTGPITIARKNEIFKVYDHTGVNYVEMYFDEPAGANWTILSDSLTCEVFLTESINEEFMCLGSCEQLYTARTSNGGPVAFVKDRRSFGTVNERILSDSAIKFIESNNRLLHENSIVNGFDYIKSTIVNGKWQLIITGGSVNINGKIVNSDSITFTSLPISRSGATNDYCDIVLCLDENGNIWWAPLTDDGSFGLITVPIDTNGGTVTLNTYPFEYIVNNRKDLIPLYQITTISSYVNGKYQSTGAYLTDIRKFTRQTHTNEISVCGEVLNNSGKNSTISGNFASLKAAVEFVYRSRIIRPKLIINGTVVLDKPVTVSDMIIEGGPYNLVKIKSASNYIKTLGNTTIKGVNFQREFNCDTSVYSNAPELGTIIGIGVDGRTYKDITIENCSFTTALEYKAQNTPHILFEQSDGGNAVFQNINIKNNTFNETYYQLTIALINRGGNSTYGTVFAGVNIDGNKSNYLSYMIIGSDRSENTTGARKGAYTYGINITNNMFGFLWLDPAYNGWIGNVAGIIPSDFNNSPIARDALGGIHLSFQPLPDFGTDVTKYYTLEPNITIANNSFIAIQNKNINGVTVVSSNDDPTIPTPNMKIINNICTSINVAMFGESRGNNNRFVGQVNISGNTLHSGKYDPSLFTPSDTISTNSKALSSTAISVTGSVTLNYSIVPLSIHDNTIQNPNNGQTDGTYSHVFDRGIFTTIPANIHHNIITTNSCNSYSIVVDFPSSNLPSNSVICKIDNNILYGNAQCVLVGYNNCLKSIEITNNVFYEGDNPILLYPRSVSAEENSKCKIYINKNIGQTFTIDGLPHCKPNALYNDVLGNSMLPWLPISPALNIDSKRLFVISPEARANGNYAVDALTVSIPYIDGAIPTSLSFTSASDLGGIKTINIKPRVPGDSIQLSSSPGSYVANNQTTVTINLTPYTQYNDRRMNIDLYILFMSQDNLNLMSLNKSDSKTEIFKITNCTITYKY